MATDPLSAQTTASPQPVTLEQLRAWCDWLAFALDNPGTEGQDALYELSARMEDALEAVIAAERPA